MRHNPCKKDCSKRSPTCHAECGAYEEFRQERLRANERRLAIKKAEQLNNDGKKKSKKGK